MAWPSTKFTSATLRTLAGSLCVDLDDSTTLAQYYTDVIEMLGKLPSPPFIERAFQKVTSGTATYDSNAIEDGAGNGVTTLIRIIYLFLEDTALIRDLSSNIEGYSEDWEADSGTPVAYTTDHVTQDSADRFIQLYPNPDTTGDAIAAVDWGANYPEGDLAYLFSELRTTDIEDYFALPIIFDLLSLEFSYPSDHQDLQYAETCRMLADFFYSLSGVK